MIDKSYYNDIKASMGTEKRNGALHDNSHNKASGRSLLEKGAHPLILRNRIY
jgi:hypothetical protein